MRMLYFKACYVESILSGEKTDTIRRPQRLPRAGELMRACVGPSRPFAELWIETVEPIALADLEPERRAEVTALYGEAGPLHRVRFRLYRVLQARPRLHSVLTRDRRSGNLQ